MTHELKQIIYKAYLNQNNGLKNVLATVVFLDGSSYRKPGVRMGICEDGTMVGAVSGGCVENVVKQRAQSVFKDKKAKVITYDGRLRLGCEGILYILIEPFIISEELFITFQAVLKNRESFEIESHFKLKDDFTGDFGSILKLNNHRDFKFSKEFKIESSKDMKIFSQTLQPCFKLLIIGGEHDAVKLCLMASILGWDIDVITSVKDPKNLLDFPGAHSVISQAPEMIDLNIDKETAVIIMTHNYALDLKFLLKVIKFKSKYIGVLGSYKRKEQLLNDIINQNDTIGDAVFSSIYSPAGLNIGAITPEEIALSILSEILALVREKEPISMRDVKRNFTK
ncbi:XdhC family protein [Winogradskyella sp. UBA3174]|uniref:XdhC family protein n=1 Tax=Winogradskyella sp. UBA3174 TaxID=1947785 RepID=UPI0025F830D4|nr:XdhC/CoxI family protein [Winogradskyella sp. UBA3174]|tara:strand:+ start:44391 stop:45407 length:1017 start_codon:yes stop_codon:yes gene_type:complete